MATDSWYITDTSPQPLLTPSAAVDPTFQPIPGAQPTCENTHQGQGQEKFTTRAGRGQCWWISGRAMLSQVPALSLAAARTACTGWAGEWVAWGAAHLSLGQLFSCQRTPRRPTSPSMRPDRPTPHAARPRRGHAWRPPPALPASLNAPAWPSQNAIAVSWGPPGATALSCNHPPQESTRMHRPTLGRT